MPLISILMPVKNAGPWLGACLRSVQAQALSAWELIAVDDGSTDNSTDILTQYAGMDSRIKWLHNPGDGIVPALIAGYENASGTYITRMDADDLMPEGKLLDLYTLLAPGPDMTVATGNVKYFSEGPVSEGYRSYETWLNERCKREDHWGHIYRECTIASPNWMMERNTFERCGGFQGLTYPEDYDLVFRWYQNKVKVLASNECTHLWREHPMRTSRISENYNQRAFFKLKINRFLELEPLGRKSLVIWGRNRKSRLIASLLAEKSISFVLLDKSNFTSIAKISDPLLLVAVYPEVGQRRAIETYLSSIGMEPGKNWWWA